MADNVPTIPVQRFQHLSEMRRDEEDWTGLARRADRKKLQNRLNQRARRRRQKNHDQNSDKQRSMKAQSDEIEDIGHGDLDVAPPIYKHTVPSIRTLCLLGKPETQDLLVKFATQALESYQSGTLNVYHLKDTVRYNVFHAFFRNARVLGFDDAWLTYDAISPFNKQGPIQALDPRPLSYPVHMRPTNLQMFVEHHPWIDFFPCPRMRDNFLQAVLELGEDAVDEDALCHDIVDGGAAAGIESAAMITWKDSWSPDGWEVTEAFVKKWGWILNGCVELQDATNSWRQRRGMGKMRFPGC